MSTPSLLLFDVSCFVGIISFASEQTTKVLVAILKDPHPDTFPPSICNIVTHIDIIISIYIIYEINNILYYIYIYIIYNYHYIILYIYFKIYNIYIYIYFIIYINIDYIYIIYIININI